MAEKLTAGQEVRVFTSRRDDEGEPGTVTRVGRRWAVATYEVELHDWRGSRSRRQREIEFDIATGYERGDEHGNGYHIRTLEQAARYRRQMAALDFLHEHGLSLNRNADLTLEADEPASTSLADALLASLVAARDAIAERAYEQRYQPGVSDPAGNYDPEGE